MTRHKMIVAIESIQPDWCRQAILNYPQQFYIQGARPIVQYRVETEDQTLRGEIRLTEEEHEAWEELTERVQRRIARGFVL